MRIRPLAQSDVREAAALHRQILDMEFLSHCGDRFMRAYYRAWIDSPGSLAEVAVDEGGGIVGVLLGATDPARHFRAMVRGHGVRIASWLGLYALLHPTFAKDLVVTRGRRYVRGLFRLAATRTSSRTPAPSSPESRRTGEITHVFVRPECHGQGIGRDLVDAALRESRRSGVQVMTLVTPPDLAARRFYERMGWSNDGQLTSRSGESFLRFSLNLSPEDGSST